MISVPPLQLVTEQRQGPVRAEQRVSAERLIRPAGFALASRRRGQHAEAIIVRCGHYDQRLESGVRLWGRNIGLRFVFRTDDTHRLQVIPECGLEKAQQEL